MHHHYSDIRDRIAEPPKWFDEYAVPRYSDFTPDETANIYANRAVLVEIECQDCERSFLVCISTGSMEQHIQGIDLWKAIADGSLHYGDPPNIQFCPAGPTMNCMDIRVVEAWDKQDFGEWTRRPELEITLADAPASP